jgi:hypothetical protein
MNTNKAGYTIRIESEDTQTNSTEFAERKRKLRQNFQKRNDYVKTEQVRMGVAWN